ncbi:hypothetical protein BY996DRAFT_6440765 [Phakopsora pachyrhizi]|nr:hypothetical protein BY996DRAFT_6440765 [Phakopsora pachyrhizi]
MDIIEDPLIEIRKYSRQSANLPTGTYPGRHVPANPGAALEALRRLEEVSSQRLWGAAPEVFYGVSWRFIQSLKRKKKESGGNFWSFQKVGLCALRWYNSTREEWRVSGGNQEERKGEDEASRVSSASKKESRGVSEASGGVSCGHLDSTTAPEKKEAESINCTINGEELLKGENKKEERVDHDENRSRNGPPGNEVKMHPGPPGQEVKLDHNKKGRKGPPGHEVKMHPGHEDKQQPTNVGQQFKLHQPEKLKIFLEAGVQPRNCNSQYWVARRLKIRVGNGLQLVGKLLRKMQKEAFWRQWEQEIYTRPLACKKGESNGKTMQGILDWMRAGLFEGMGSMEEDKDRAGGGLDWRTSVWWWKEEAGGGCGGRFGRIQWILVDCKEEGEEKLGGGANQGQSSWSKTTGAMDL